MGVGGGSCRQPRRGLTEYDQTCDATAAKGTHGCSVALSFNDEQSPCPLGTSRIIDIKKELNRCVPYPVPSAYGLSSTRPTINTIVSPLMVLQVNRWTLSGSSRCLLLGARISNLL